MVMWGPSSYNNNTKVLNHRPMQLDQNDTRTFQTWYGLTNSGIWLPYSISDVTMGRCTTDCFAIMSFAGTASSNSNARIRVKSSAFILSRVVRLRCCETGTLSAHSTIENRYPMHARGPPRNDSWLLQIPGMLWAPSGTDSHRSGPKWRHQFHITWSWGTIYIPEDSRVLAPDILWPVYR